MFLGQSSNDILAAEQLKTLVVFIIKSGVMNKTEFLQAFSEMFKWNWQWRAKSYGQNCYLMRVASKAKLVELAKFNEFNLLGT